jgi:hypothetical protein
MAPRFNGAAMPASGFAQAAENLVSVAAQALRVCSQPQSGHTINAWLSLYNRQSRGDNIKFSPSPTHMAHMRLERI